MISIYVGGHGGGHGVFVVGVHVAHDTNLYVRAHHRPSWWEKYFEIFRPILVNLKSSNWRRSQRHDKNISWNAIVTPTLLFDKIIIFVPPSLGKTKKQF